MSRRYEFDEGGFGWADVEDLGSFEGELDPGDEFLVVGNAYGSAYVFHGTRESIATDLRKMLEYVETVDPPRRVTDNAELAKVTSATPEFLYSDGASEYAEEWVTVEPHEHDFEDFGEGKFVCAECPYTEQRDA